MGRYREPMVVSDRIPVVLLHAFPLSSGMYEPLRASLAALGQPPLDLLTPDFRGVARTPLGEATPSLDVLADDVAALLDAQEIDRAVIGGVSMGGYVTMAFLRRHPQRVAAIVLADTKASADAEPARANRLRTAESLEAERSVRVLVEEALPTLIGESTAASRPQVLAFIRSVIEATPPAAAAWWQRAMAQRPDSTATLRGVDVPALVIVGEEDALAPVSEAEAMVAALARGRLAVLPGAGHLAAVETPDAFATALADFVAALA